MDAAGGRAGGIEETVINAICACGVASSRGGGREGGRRRGRDRTGKESFKCSVPSVFFFFLPLPSFTFLSTNKSAEEFFFFFPNYSIHIEHIHFVVPPYWLADWLDATTIRTREKEKHELRNHRNGPPFTHDQSHTHLN